MGARRVRAVLCVVALAAAVCAGAPALAVPTLPASSVPAPTITLPPDGTRGYALWDSYYDLKPFGYEEQEYFASGTARDAAGATAPYTTRIIVTRPASPARFNGTVVLDWVNVTAQFENAVDTMEAREMLMREGFAYVHVSAQSAGLCCTPLTPQVWDPARYASLHHPGDDFSFDLFSQVAQAFRAPRSGSLTLDPMGALGAKRVKHVLAVGQSQSGSRLYDYVNEWLPAHPDALGLIDGFLVHGAASSTKRFAAPLPARVKVLQLLSDLEADPSPITPDPNHRVWEVAGTAHSDYFIGYQSVFGHGPRVLSGADKIDRAAYERLIDDAGNYGAHITPFLATCTVAGATMPMHYAASTAIHRLDAWVGGQGAPPNGPRFEFDGDALAKDEFDNAKGGIRLPPADVPVARYETTACGLGGVTVPFTDAQIQTLYPTHAAYVARMQARTDAAVRGGWLLKPDAADLMRRVCAASDRWPPPAAASCPAAA